MTALIKNAIRQGKSLSEVGISIGGCLTTDNISYDELYKIGKKKHGNKVWEALDSGHTIIANAKQQEQYWYSYAPMIKSQWSVVLSELELLEGDLTIVDYGCGQGGASALFLDKFRKAHRVTQVTLIEPSAIALDSAQAIVQCYLPDATITTVQKELDDLTPTDGPPQTDTARVHILSNILDIPRFNIKRLADTVAKNFSGVGLNYILAVSNAREIKGGTNWFLSTCKALFDHPDLKIIKNKADYFTAQMLTRESPAVYCIFYYHLKPPSDDSGDIPV